MKFVWQNGRKVSPYFLKKDEIQESAVSSSSQSSTEELEEVPHATPPIVSPYFSNKNNPNLKNNAIHLDTLFKQFEYNPSNGRDDLKVISKQQSRDTGKKSKVKESKIGKMPKKVRVQEDDEQIGKPLIKSGFSAAEMWNDAYKKRTPDNTWVPPPSNIPPLIQEYHVHDPWRVLCVCILLNKTDGHNLKSRTIIFNFFRLCPDAQSCIKVQKDEITQVIAKLGLQNKRSEKLQRFSHEYLEGSWTHVTQLHGIGKYAADAYAIFCTGMWDRVTPDDSMLIKYWHFLHSIKHTL